MSKVREAIINKHKLGLQWSGKHTYRYIPSSTSGGTSSSTRTSSVGACIPNHRRAIAIGFIFGRMLCICALVISMYTGDGFTARRQV